MKLRTQVLNYLKHERDWVHSGTLERVEFRRDKGGMYKPSTVSRCLRLLCEEQERVQKRYERGSVLYRYIFSEYEKHHERMTNAGVV